MKTTLRIILLAILASATGMTWRFLNEADQARLALAEFGPERTRLRAAIASVEERLRAANKADSSPTASEANAGTPPPIQLKRPSVWFHLAQDPKRLSEVLQSYRSTLDTTYSGLFTALGLSDQQIQRFKDLKTARYQEQIDQWAALAVHDVTGLSAAGRKLEREHDDKWTAKERELFGDLGPLYQKYAYAEKVRECVREVAGTGASTGEPMTLAQIERATQILAANSRTGPDGLVERSAVNWDAARAQLAGVLSTNQIATLGEVLEERNSVWKLAQLRERLIAEFKARMPGS
jgi:hypothetical protein